MISLFLAAAAAATAQYPQCIEHRGDELSPVEQWATFDCPNEATIIKSDQPNSILAAEVHPFVARRIKDDKRVVGLAFVLRFRTDPDDFVSLSLTQATALFGGQLVQMRGRDLNGGSDVKCTHYDCFWTLQSQVLLPDAGATELLQDLAKRPDAKLDIRLFYTDAGEVTLAVPVSEIGVVADASGLFAANGASPAGAH